MPSLDATNLASLDLFQKDPPLDSATLPQTIKLDLGQKKFSEALTWEGQKVGTADARFEAGCALAVVNGPKSPNVEELFDLGKEREPEEEAEETGLLLEPPLHFDKTKAYLIVTGLSVSGKISGAPELGDLGAGLDASANLSFAHCFEFPRGAALKASAESALRRFKTVFNAEELSRLGGDETLTLGLGGELKLSLSVTAASLADAAASALKTALGNLEGVAFECSATAKVEVSLTVSGGYRLFARRGAAEGSVEFSLRKTASRILGVGGSIGAKAQVKDVGELLKTLSNLVGQVTKLPASLLEKALQGIDGLNEDELKLVDTALEKLGLKDPAVPAWQTLKKALEGFVKTTKSLLEKSAEAAFSYTWKRTTEDSIVARFTLTPEALARHLLHVLTLNVEAVLCEGSRPGSGVDVDRFLGRKTELVELGYGFAFSLASFRVLKGWDTLSRRYVWQKDLDGRVSVAFLGKRGYQSVWLGNKTEHIVELDASLPHFVVQPPAPSEFETGFLVSFSWENTDLADLALDLADHALLVKALPGDDVAEARDTLLAKGLPPKQGGKAVVSLLVPPEAAGRLLAQATGSAADDLVPLALARALPCGTDGLAHPARRILMRRMNTYGPVWRSFIATYRPGLDWLGNLAAEAIENEDSVLAGIERDPRLFWGWSVRGIVQVNGGPIEVEEKIAALRRGLLELWNRNKPGVDYRVFEKSLSLLSPLVAEHFGTRTFAALLLLAAERDPGLSDRLVRKLCVSWKTGETEHRLLFKQGGVD